jgi:hypothetical protein
MEFTYKRVLCGTQNGDDNEYVTMGRNVSTVHFILFSSV